MAGDTSRFLISLSIPLFSLIFWFLKRKALKSVVSQAVQVEDPVASEFEIKLLELDPMKFKNSEENRKDRSDSSTMLVKENTSLTPNASDVAQQNGSSPSKSKLREKSGTCPADYIVNDSLHDNGSDLAVAFENIDLNTNGSDQDELLNAVNNSEMDINTNCVSQSDAHIANGGEESVSENATELQNGECAKECDNLDSPDPKVDSCNRTDSQESLILADSMDVQGDPSSTAATYCDSVISNDSGRGGSEIHALYPETNVLTYAFEISSEYVGRLIGKHGSTVKSIKNQTNTDIIVKRHPSSRESKLCVLTGTDDEINSALRLIRRKFPFEKYPSVTLSQICFNPFTPSAENLMLRLPETTSVDVTVSSTVSAGHFFIQQLTHPTYHSLPQFIDQMNHVYNMDVNAPALLHMEKGYICVVKDADIWYRAEIDEVFPDRDECQIKFLDYGPYAVVPRSTLRQINYQFMNLPFQATECYLAHVSPFEGETEWSQQATDYFEQLAKHQLLQCAIVGYADNGIPFVQLYKILGDTILDINRELINSGLVRSIEPQPELVS